MYILFEIYLLLQNSYCSLGKTLQYRCNTERYIIHYIIRVVTCYYITTYRRYRTMHEKR